MEQLLLDLSVAFDTVRLFVANSSWQLPIGRPSADRFSYTRCSQRVLLTVGGEHSHNDYIGVGCGKAGSDLRLQIVIQSKGLDGKWTNIHRLIQSPTCFICVTRPPEICVNVVCKHIHAVSSYYHLHSIGRFCRYNSNTVIDYSMACQRL